MTNRPGCYNPATLFKPQWAYQTPAGYRDEPYLIPFSFRLKIDGSAQLNLPLQLDDDAPFIWREIQFPAVGPLLSGGFGFPGLVRIYDSHGNPLTDGLIYALGVYGLSGLTNMNAFGFPIEPEIECSAGGALLFDFQMSSNGFYASFLYAALLGTVLFYSTIFGTAGNALTIQLINPGAPNVPLSVAIVGGVHVQVTLATDGGSAIISTLAQVAAIINGTPAIAAVMLASVQSVPGDLATALAQTPLAGGANGTTGVVNGTLIGVKRWRECL